MNSKAWFKTFVLALIVFATVGFIGWQVLSPASGRVAFAQGGTTTPSATPSAAATATSSPSASPLAPSAPGAQSTTGPLQNFWQAFAAQLGMQEADVKAKAVAAMKALVDQAVKNGRLTQAQGNAIKQQLDANGPTTPGLPGAGRFGLGQQGQTLPGGGMLGRFGGTLRSGLVLDELEAVAKALNLSPSQLVTQLLSGKSLADVVKAQNVSEDTVKQAIINTAKASLTREVQDGLITQAEADAILLNLTPQNIDLSRYLLLRGGLRMGQQQFQQQMPRQQMPRMPQMPQGPGRMMPGQRGR